MAAPERISVALHARAFLHTFLQETRLHPTDPKLQARLLKKMRKFDSRGPRTAVGTAPDAPATHQVTIKGVINHTAAPDSIPDRGLTPIAQPQPIPDTRATIHPAQVRQRTPISVPVAGPGPSTEAHYVARAAAAAAMDYADPSREVALTAAAEEMDAANGNGERGDWDMDLGKSGGERDEHTDIRMGDLNADGDDEAGMMEAVNRTVDQAMKFVDEDEENESQEDTHRQKGKQRARSPEDPIVSDSSKDSDAFSDDHKVIVSRPRPRPRADRGLRKGVAINPSGRYLDPPCIRCVKAGLACEKDRGGGACVFCKKRKQSCEYAVRRNKKKMQSKPEIESEDDDSEPPVPSRSHPRVSLPEIACLTPPSAPTRPRTRAPPVREARTRATEAIREFSQTGLARPVSEHQRPRRAPPSGTHSRSAGMGEST